MADVGIRVIVSGVAEARRNLGAINSDVATLGKTIQSVSGVTSQLGTTLQNVGSALTAAGRTMTIAVTAPIAAMGATAIQAGIEFEAAFAGVGKTVEGVATSTGELTALGQQIREEFRQMALDIPIATNELVALGEVVGQLGVQAESVAEVTEIIAMLGATTELSAEEAAKGLIHFANILGVTAKDAAAFEDFLLSAGSAVVALGNASVSTEGEILNLALRLAAAGDNARMTAPEILAWATTLSDLGVRAEAGGSAVSRAINEMLFAVQEGGEGLEAFAEVSGKTVDQFVQDFKEDASGALLDFVAGFKDALSGEGSIEDFQQKLNEMGLSGVRAMDILARLGDTEALFAENLRVANLAWEEQIALQEEFNKRSATVQAQIQLLKNAFTDLGIEIFDLVKEDITNLLLGIRELIKDFKDLDPNIQKSILMFAGLAAAIGPVLIVAGALISSLGLVVSGIAALLSPVGLATVAVAGLAGVLGALILPNLLADLSQVEIKIADIARALGFLQQPDMGDPMNANQAEQQANAPEQFTVPTFETFLEGVKELAGEDIAIAIENIGRIGDSLADIFNNLVESETVSKSLDSIRGSLSDMGKTLKDFSLGSLEGLATWLEDHENELTSVGEGIAVFAATLVELANGLLSVGSALAGGTFEILGDGLSILLDLITGDIDGALEGINELLKDFAFTLLDVGNAILQAGIDLADMFSDQTREEIVATWEGIFDNISIIFNQWWGSFSGSWSGVWENIKTIASIGAMGILSAIGAPLGQFVTDVINSAKDAAAGFGASVGLFAGHAANFINTAISNFAAGIGTFIANASSTASNAASSFGASVGAFAANGAAFITQAVVGFVSGVAGFISEASSAASDAAAGFAGAAGDFAGAGAAFIQGAIGGIEGLVGDLVAAAAGAAAAAAEAFAGALQAQSPSQVTWATGEDFMTGAIGGIDSHIDKLIATAQAAANKTSDAFLNELTSTFSDNAAALPAELAEQLNNMASSVSTTFSNALVAQLPPELLAAWGQATGGATTMFNTMGSTASNTSNTSNTTNNINQVNNITGNAANNASALASYLNQQLSNATAN